MTVRPIVDHSQAETVPPPPEAEPLARVLVVDDDERNLLAVSNVLEDIGEVVTARSGEEALRHLLKDEFAVILLDVYMPGMDGYETAQIIRSREQTKRIPIVFLSAVNKETEHLLRGYEMGAVDYVFKPVDPVVLRSKIAVFVDLFAKTREIEQKAKQEQALLDANLRANSERLRVEQELRHAESQLFQAQKMDAIGKLTGGVAHDFNNLLAAVIGGLGLLERRAKLDPPQHEILAMTRRAAEQGTELVRRLLAFARRQQLQPANIDIAALETSVSGLLAHTLGGLVEVEWRVEGKLWQAFADPGQLELALMNLVINARDAMPDGGKIVVAATNRMVEQEQGDGLKPGHYVVLTVSDGGCGIPAEMIEEVLQPFVTTKDIGKGTGLGLSMVYGFARQSNGAFRLTSEVGVGTEAQIWLPRAAKSERVAKRVARDVAVANGKRLRILLVDDHAEVREATVGMLEDLGHRVTAAAIGSEALDLLSGGGQFDLLVTDYAMPKLSGTELIGKVRKLIPGMPSMIITGYADNDALAGRFKDVVILSKPFTLDNLATAIGQSVKARGRTAEAAGGKS